MSADLLSVYDRLQAAVTPRAFEHFIANVFQSQGYTAQVTGGANDQGVDIRLWRDNRHGIVQCKFTFKAITPHTVRDLYGTLAHEGADEAWLVTPGWVTEQGRAWARGKPIHIVDGWRFIFWLAYDSLEQADRALARLARLQDRDVLRFLGAVVLSAFLSVLFAAQRRKVLTLPVLALGGRPPLFSALVVLFGLASACAALVGLTTPAQPGVVLAGAGGLGALLSVAFFVARARQRQSLIEQVVQSVLARLDVWEYAHPSNARHI